MLLTHLLNRLNKNIFNVNLTGVKVYIFFPRQFTKTWYNKGVDNLVRPK